ncbi:amidohydrolase family protein [Hamadaea tsunoensis]|uniref:amidohydrolase family protein n=1 Tax=Hamadaea tsunoensis TaxID=53368 RepID=UPI0003FC03D1|nr:amidohydrolase family protein [Hamadaea tsunoensis]
MEVLDAHCHTVELGPLTDERFAAWCTESPWPPAPGTSFPDSRLGLAIRRWCAPALGLSPFAPLAEYAESRRSLPDAGARLLAAAGLSALLVDTGLTGGAALDELAAAAHAPVHSVVRLEQLAVSVAETAGGSGFGRSFSDALAAQLDAGAVAVKSIAAYRHGLDLDPERPGPAEVVRAADAWLRSGERLADPVLLRHLLWTAVDCGRPIQFHTGFGDPDAALLRADPAHLQPFCAATRSARVPIVLLHCYPYHRQAAWLAQLYPHVYADVGLAVTYTGARFDAVLAEFLELAPFGKVLYSSDAYGLPELYLVGAQQFRHSIRHVLADLPPGEAERIAGLVAAGNARRVYALDA